MRFRHAPFLLLAAASLLLTAAAPTTGTAPTADASAPAVLAAPGSLSASVGATASAGGSRTVDPYQRASDAIVAMTSGPERTGSAVVVSPGLIVTSTHVVKKGSTTAIMTVDGGFATFKVEATDKRLGLVLLRASGMTAQPVVWGKGRALLADDAVPALGLGSGTRSILVQKGKLVSPAAATGNDLMITDIKIDPLVEGGPLVSPDGKIVGIVVARGQGEAGGQLGWAVTSEAVQEFVKGVQEKDRLASVEASKRTFRRIVAWSVLLSIVAVLVLLARMFQKWYRKMEAREAAEMAAAEEAAKAAASADGTAE